MQLVDLDPETRDYMRMEISDDIENDRLYVSSRLSASGRAEYAQLLLDAVNSGTDSTLAAALAVAGRLNTTETSHTKTGKVIEKAVPSNAHETLAEGEFNRFYVRGLCARVVAHGDTDVEVYRAKPVTEPRSQSSALIGTSVNAKQLLNDLRAHVGVDTALGLPGGPNSGLSVRLIKKS